MFLLSQNDENQSENGSKNSKIRLRARPPAEPQKKMLQTKNWGQKVEKHGVFSLFRLPILDGRVHEQVSSVLFFTVFFEGERHDLSKTGGFGRKMPPPPGKPVTFYECHPDDHAPAPSVRADLSSCLKWRNVRPGQMVFGYVWQDAKLAIPLAIRQRYTFLQKAAANHCKTLSSVPLAFPCLSSSIPFPASSFALLSFSFPRLFLSQICALHLQNLAIDPQKR